MRFNKRLFSAAIINLAFLTATNAFPVFAQQPQIPTPGTRSASTRGAYKVNFSHYYLWAYTNGDGYFSVPHELPQGHNIYGLQVAVQHTNGNWHTLEFSHAVDNRFWWNGTHVQGIINSPAFRNRYVHIVLTVYP
jgi:hypothetical protein